MERAFATLHPAEAGPPPVQTDLILADLAELGFVAPTASADPGLADNFEALGAAWVVAGSSLGNRAMLARRRKAGLEGADRFLSDTTMPDYFGGLLPALEEPANHTQFASVVDGAHKTFQLFETAFAGQQFENAA